MIVFIVKIGRHKRQSLIHNYQKNDRKYIIYFRGGFRMDESKLIRVMDYIRRFSDENGYMPSVREIGMHCGIKSTATVHSYMERLQDKGFLNKADNKKRAVTIGKSNSVNIPLLGTVTAGQPILLTRITKNIILSLSANFAGKIFSCFTCKALR